jgi:hypothetical protein
MQEERSEEMKRVWNYQDFDAKLPIMTPGRPAFTTAASVLRRVADRKPENQAEPKRQQQQHERLCGGPLGRRRMAAGEHEGGRDQGHLRGAAHEDGEKQGAVGSQADLWVYLIRFEKHFCNGVEIMAYIMRACVHMHASTQKIPPAVQVQFA